MAPEPLPPQPTRAIFNVVAGWPDSARRSKGSDASIRPPVAREASFKKSRRFTPGLSKESDEDIIKDFK